MKHIRALRGIWTSIDSPDAKVMYSAAGKMMAYPNGKGILPKAVDLFEAEDMTVRRLMFRTAARNVFGDYITLMFSSFVNITPAEREQVLQVIEEKFRYEGGPQSTTQHKLWIEALEKLGREHQSTVFGIMAYLGRLGTKWVTDKIKNHIETVSYGAIQRLTFFPEATRKRLIPILIRKSLERKRELIPYILDILDSATIRYAEIFLKNGNWRERVLVATRMAELGIVSSTGIVLDILADTDWRVKQALLESVNLKESKFPAVMKVLSYVATDSHARVRGAAERLILRLGVELCADSDLETQRKRIQKKYRKQLLRAAPLNKDIDSSWLGVEIQADATIPYIEDVSEEGLEGVSLEDFEDTPDKEQGSPQSPTASALLAALKGARAAASEDKSTATLAKKFLKSETHQTTQDMIVEVIKKLSDGIGKDVPLDALRKELAAEGIADAEFDKALSDLEREGIIYQSGRGTVSYVEMDL
ncbi:MAG: hypothetical protein K9W43_11490 [Candidatus Thorarchaeota archaeon]|nr:hypothetical protein [Candidatus Thorarchaeota archaeon]